MSRVRFPGVICGLRLFVVGSLPCFEKFFSGYSGFPLSSKTTISKFKFDLDYCQALYHEPLAWVIAQALPVFDIKFKFNLHFAKGLDSRKEACMNIAFDYLSPFRIEDNKEMSKYTTKDVHCPTLGQENIPRSNARQKNGGEEIKGLELTDT